MTAALVARGRETLTTPAGDWRDRPCTCSKRTSRVLGEGFGVVRLALFASTARDTAGPDGGIDLLVIFDGPATSQRDFGVQFYLEDLRGRSVDLVTEKALRERLRPYVERDAIAVLNATAASSVEDMLSFCDHMTAYLAAQQHGGGPACRLLSPPAASGTPAPRARAARGT